MPHGRAEGPHDLQQGKYFWPQAVCREVLRRRRRHSAIDGNSLATPLPPPHGDLALKAGGPCWKKVQSHLGPGSGWGGGCVPVCAHVRA